MRGTARDLQARWRSIGTEKDAVVPAEVAWRQVHEGEYTAASRSRHDAKAAGSAATTRLFPYPIFLIHARDKKSSSPYSSSIPVLVSFQILWMGSSPLRSSRITPPARRAAFFPLLPR